MPAGSALEPRQGVDVPAAAPLARLIVTWQEPESRLYRAVGVLEQRVDGFEFAYLRNAVARPGFLPFLGFPDLRLRYRSPRLFPLFAERVMDPARSDRPAWLEALGLEPDVGPMEILARSGGHRAGDTIELLPEPSVSPAGVAETLFLVHGVRHQAGASEHIDHLRAGDPLALAVDEDNPINDRALLVTAENRPLGWVPDPLLPFVHDLRLFGDPEVRVERANGPEVGSHLRLLVRIRGHVPPGYRAFEGPEWEVVA
jgi:hypothetical protein